MPIPFAERLASRLAALFRGSVAFSGPPARIVEAGLQRPEGLRRYCVAWPSRAPIGKRPAAWRRRLGHASAGHGISTLAAVGVAGDRRARERGGHRGRGPGRMERPLRQRGTRRPQGRRRLHRGHHRPRHRRARRGSGPGPRGRRVAWRPAGVSRRRRDPAQAGRLCRGPGRHAAGRPRRRPRGAVVRADLTPSARPSVRARARVRTVRRSTASRGSPCRRRTP